jgi:hypothetical protein
MEGACGQDVPWVGCVDLLVQTLPRSKMRSVRYQAKPVFPNGQIGQDMAQFDPEET